MKKYYKIRAICKTDAFYSDRSDLIGAIVTPVENTKIRFWRDSKTCGGEFEIVKSVSEKKAFAIGEYFCFHSIQLKQVEY